MDRFYGEKSPPVCEKYCDNDYYLNELACECFSLAQCFAPCPKDEFIMPTEHCGCTKDYDEYLALFPASATDEDIDFSIEEGIRKHSNNQPVLLTIPELWPDCEIKSKCEFGTLNYLACQCFSDVQCMMWCGDDMLMDPTKGCTCITQAEYDAYFPDWVDQKDIDYSYKLQWQQFDTPPTPETEPEPVHPGFWPECNPAPLCAGNYYLNELACDCWAIPATVICDIACLDM